MQVETFEDITTDEQNGQRINEEVSEEALALIDTLGLEGQRSLVHRATVGVDEVVERRMPYRQITLEESRIYQLVMPEKTDLSSFDLGPIPLRVLQVAAHAKPMMDELVVWHQANVKEDPVLVGHTGSPYSRERKTYILARWGEVLVPLDELRVKARDILLAKMKLAISEGRAEIDQFESTLKDAAAVFLQGTGRAKSAHVSLSLGQ